MKVFDFVRLAREYGIHPACFYRDRDTDTPTWHGYTADGRAFTLARETWGQREWWTIHAGNTGVNAPVD